MAQAFEEWLEQTDSMRSAIESHAESPLPADASERHAEIELAIKMQNDAELMLADCEFFLTRETEKAMLCIRENFPDYTAKEREVSIRAHVSGLQRIADKLAASGRTMKSRLYAAMNANRSNI